MDNMHVRDGDAVSLISPEGEILCVMGPEWLEENPDIEAISRLEYERAKKLRELSWRRDKAIDGWMEFSGLRLATDAESRGFITGAAVQATLDPDYSCRWKTAQGFVSLTAGQVLAIAGAVRAHVQACFDKEAALAAQVSEAETAEAVRGISWDGND